jgi:hypothetical protein
MSVYLNRGNYRDEENGGRESLQFNRILYGEKTEPNIIVIGE